jgi:hypothetical protein
MAHLYICYVMILSVLRLSQEECARFQKGVPYGKVPYTDIIQNTYVQSWMVTEIMAREKCGLLAGPCTVAIS